MNNKKGRKKLKENNFKSAQKFERENKKQRAAPTFQQTAAMSKKNYWKLNAIYAALL